MRVVPESVHELLVVLVNKGVTRDFVSPRIEFGLLGEFSEDKQVRGFQEITSESEIRNRVSPVFQNPLFTVDERDPALAGSRVLESRIVGHESEIIVLDLDLTQVHGIDRIVVEVDFVCSAGSIVGNCQSVLRHVPSSQKTKVSLFTL